MRKFLLAALFLLPLGACMDEEIAPNPLQLVGRTWVAEEINGTATAAGSESTLIFAANGRLKGNTGCNNMMGEVKLSADTISVPGPLATTRMACGDESLGGQERRFTETLTTAARWEIKEGLLYIYDAAGKPVMRLHQQEEKPTETATAE